MTICYNYLNKYKLLINKKGEKIMFSLDDLLKNKIDSKLNKKLCFCAISQVSCQEDCYCKGACGTYTPPCSCCAYN